MPAAPVAKAKRPADASRGTRLPQDWWPDPACSAFAGNAGLDATKEADAFRDYWLARPGAGGRKLDWSATWRNHCREQASRNKARFAPRKMENKTDWLVRSGIIEDLPHLPPMPPREEAPHYDIDATAEPEDATPVDKASVDVPWQAPSPAGRTRSRCP